MERTVVVSYREDSIRLKITNVRTDTAISVIEVGDNTYFFVPDASLDEQYKMAVKLGTAIAFENAVHEQIRFALETVDDMLASNERGNGNPL